MTDLVQEKEPLTEHQQRVFAFIKGYIDRHRMPPTYREIAEELGIYINAVKDYVERIERKGWIGLRRNSGVRGRVGRTMRGIFVIE